MTQPHETPQTFGPYRILSSLGQGGMGRVYQAQHESTGQVVALKTVRMTHTKFMHQIRREIHALSQLRHPGVVSIVDHGVSEGQPWYAMEMIQGVTLRDWMKQHPPGTPSGHSIVPNSDSAGTEFETQSPALLQTNVEQIQSRLYTDTQEGEGWWADTVAERNYLRLVQNSNSSAPPPRREAPKSNSSRAKHPAIPTHTFRVCDPASLQQTLEMTWKICQPLFYLHGEGIIHCDLKPNNILIREDGWPVIIDFGLLTQFSNAISRETLDTLQLGLGTLPYMAPEQLEGKLLDARADLYALGCLLYEWLTGAPPFVGEPGTIVVQHLTKIPPPPSYWVKGLPPSLDQLVLRLLAKSPHERIGYADTVRYTLHSLLRSLSHPAPASWPGVNPRRPRVYLYRPQLAGRRAVLESLVQQLGPLYEGEKSVVLLRGESGVGKTRLFLELAGQALFQDIKVLTSECLEHHPKPLSMFQPLFQAITDRARNAEPDTIPQILGPDSWAILPYSRELQSLPGQSENPTVLDLKPSQAYLLVSRALRHMLSTYAQERPLVLLLDDLQWADSFSLHVLEHLVQEPPPFLMIVGSYRSEEETDTLTSLSKQESVTSISLERLGVEAVGSMVQDMLALAEVPEGFSQYLAQHSEGNPFFVAEYLRSAVNEGMLWRNPQGVWQFGNHAAALSLSPYDSQLPLPPSLQELLKRRLQDVSLDASEVMAAAAILGRESSLSLLQAITRFSWEQLWGALEELQRRELLEDSSADRVRFVHDKLRETAKTQLSPEQAKALHHLAASAMEMQRTSSNNHSIADLAEHWHLAGENEKASYYYKEAAEQARKQYANNQAIACYQSYLDLAETDTLEALEVRIELGDLLRTVGQVPKAEATYKQAVAQAQKDNHRQQEGESLTQLGLLYWHTGQIEQASTIFTQALAIHQEQGNRRGEGLVLGYFAGISLYRGDMDNAQKQYQTALGVHREVGNHEAEGRDLSNLGNIYLERCDLNTARSYYEASLDLLQAPQSQRFRIMVLNNLAHVFSYQYENAQAATLYEEMLQRARHLGERASEGMALGNLAHAKRELGEVEQAQQLFDEAIRIHRKLDNRLFEAIHRIQQLVLERLLGNPPLSLKATLLRAKKILESTGNTFYQALIDCEAGHLELVHLRSAESHLHQALERAATAGITPNSPSEVGIALARLQRAQRGFENNLFLYCGQLMDDIPPGLRKRLQADGLLE